jgi:hypothetical protein
MLMLWNMALLSLATNLAVSLVRDQNPQPTPAEWRERIDAQFLLVLRSGVAKVTSTWTM